MSASHSFPTIAQKNEREELKWMTMSILFFVALRIGSFYV